MSVWSYVEGVAYIKHGSGVSIRTAIEEYFGNSEAVPTISQKKLSHDTTKVIFQFSYSEEGGGAWRTANKFLDYLNSKDVKHDIEITIRCLH